MADDPDPGYEHHYYYAYQAPPTAGLAVLWFLYAIYDYVSGLLLPYKEAVAASFVITLIALAALAFAVVSTGITWPVARKLTAESGWNKSLWKLSFIAMGTSILTVMGAGMIFSANLDPDQRVAMRPVAVILGMAIAVVIHGLVFHKSAGFRKGSILGAANLAAFAGAALFLFPRSLLH